MVYGDSVRVTIKQLWVDNDTRAEMWSGKRFLRVIEVSASRYVTCEAWYEHKPLEVRRTKIRLDRFRPRSNGYRLATPEEVEAVG